MYEVGQRIKFTDAKQRTVEGAIWKLREPGRYSVDGDDGVGYYVHELDIIIDLPDVDALEKI